MIKYILNYIKSLFTHKQKSIDQYELVECRLSDDMYRQGIRLLSPQYHNMVITIDPKVSVVAGNDGETVLQYSFTVEANPNHIDYDKTELYNHVGDILVDLIQKDNDT